LPTSAIPVEPPVSAFLELALFVVQRIYFSNPDRLFFFPHVVFPGKSKGVMLTHRNITSNLVQIMSYDAEVIKEKDLVILGFLPLYHIYGLMNCLHISLITVTYNQLCLFLGIEKPCPCSVFINTPYAFPSI